MVLLYIVIHIFNNKLLPLHNGADWWLQTNTAAFTKQIFRGETTSLLFLTVQSLFIIRLCTNKIALKFTLLKQHIKMIVLF